MLPHHPFREQQSPNPESVQVRFGPAPQEPSVETPPWAEDRERVASSRAKGARVRILARALAAQVFRAAW